MWAALAAGGLSGLQGRRDNMFNKEEADRARDWSKELANTEMQRRVADLKAAGLNPMLAIQGSGSTPSATSASAAGGSDIGRAASGAYFSAQQMKLMKDKNAVDIAQVEANTAKTIAETKLLSDEGLWSAQNAQSRSEKLFSEAKMLASQVSTARSDAEIRQLQIEGQRLINKAAAAQLSRKEVESLLWENLGAEAVKLLNLDEYLKSGEVFKDAGRWSSQKFDEFKEWARSKHK